VVARILGPENKGVYYMIFQVVIILSVVSNLGIGIASVYFLGKKRAEPSDILSNSLWFALGVGSILAAAFVAWTSWGTLPAFIADHVELYTTAVWVLPVAFPMVMALGGMLGLLGIPIPGVEVGIALSALVLGCMVLTECRPALWFAGTLVGFFAIFHGHAHGTELPEGSSGLLYSVGFVVATGLLHGVGIATGLIHRWNGGRQLIRIAGASVAVAGVYFLWKATI